MKTATAVPLEALAAAVRAIAPPLPPEQASLAPSLFLRHARSSELGAFYRRLFARIDKPRANTTLAHKLARMVYFMLTRGEDYVDQGQQHYEDQQRQRSIAASRRRAADLGFAISPAATTA
jgi:hypothetical protein